MPDQSVLEYIRQCQKLGSPKEPIIQNLLQSGWTREIIDEAFASLDNTAALSASAHIADIEPQVPASGSSTATIQVNGTSNFISERSLLLGFIGIFASALLFWLYYKLIFNGSIAIYIALYEIIIAFASSLFLFVLSKMFKVEGGSFAKAIFFSGSVGLAMSIAQLLHLVGIPTSITSLLSFLISIASFYLLMKIYNLKVGKAIGLGIVNIFITVIFAVIIGFVFAIAGFLKFQTLYQSSSAVPPPASQQTMNPTESDKTNAVGIQEQAPTVPFIDQESAITNCGEVIKDRDGYSYKTVQIGSQCWLAQNLMTKTKPDGTALTSLSDEAERDCVYHDQERLFDRRGTEADCIAGHTLYTWNGAMNGSTSERAQGICMKGWHIPSNDEQALLEQRYASEANTADCVANRLDTACAPAGTELIIMGNSDLNLTANGYWDSESKEFKGFGDYFYLLSSSTEADFVITRFIDQSFGMNNLGVARNRESKTSKFPVRCVKD